MRLYEMTQAGAELYELLQADEIDEQTLKDTLEGMGANEKLEACCQVINQLKGESDMFAAEKERCYKAEQKCKKDIERIKGNMLAFLESTGQKAVEVGTFRVVLSYRDKVAISNQEAIPEQFYKEQPKKLSLADIKEALKQGQEIPGAELIKNGGVQIK